ncbi:MAG: ACT domain-containing protein [Thermoplasmatota archaeon]
MASTLIPLALLDETFAVCRMDPKERTPAWVLEMPAQLVALIRTPKEVCILCDEADVPRSATAVERGFRAFVLDGTIPHAVTGVLNSLTRPLAEAGISVFSLFTYDTNYLLVKDADVGRAAKALESAGFPVTEKEIRAS